METWCPPGYHHNNFVSTYALEHMIIRLYTAVTNESSVTKKPRK